MSEKAKRTLLRCPRCGGARNMGHACCEDCEMAERRLAKRTRTRPARSPKVTAALKMIAGGATLLVISIDGRVVVRSFVSPADGAALMEWIRQ